MPNMLAPTRGADQLLVQNYEKDAISPGVMHLGVGAFHRAHQAVYFDRLLSKPAGKHWGLIGVNIRPQDSQGFTQLNKQNGEYVLKTMSPKGEAVYEHIRAITQLVDGAIEPETVDHLMADNQIQLITTTVTEGGYYLDENNQLMQDHPLIKDDLSSGRNTLYAFLYAGLKKRSETSASKITLLCCDNLRHNGKLLKTGLLQFLKAKQDESLHAWALENCSFPSSMVDRITPKPSIEHQKDVQSRFNIEDNMTVMAEDFIQWVVEDDFAGERPPLHKVDVQLVEDVTPFEEAKIRILNAGHTCVAYQAALKGLDYFDQAMMDMELKVYFSNFIKQDAIPAIGQSVVDLSSYAKVIALRFSNTNIGDTVERICTDGYAKFPIFVYPTLAGIYQLGGIPNKTIDAIASWFVFIHQTAQGKLQVNYYEPNMDKLAAFTNDEKGIHAFATDTYLWQDLPEAYPDFVSRLSRSIKQTQLRFSA
ncbi:mannitol dehydrogenase family protein [Marinomonas sp. PE14-40]|uniref:mannitol dehydrogenase family protein n=1 Tax=Marinomonas sp. PE14-40 TaxID=3060621 RepID=UPI003F66C3D5